MKRQVSVILSVAAILLGLLVTARGVAAQPRNPVEVVRAFLEAISNNDAATAKSLIAPDSVIVGDPGTPEEEIGPLGEFVDSVLGQGFVIKINSAEETSPGVVVTEFELTGGDIPPLPNPFTIIATATVTDGKIMRWEEVLTEQTQRDLEVLESSGPTAPPGMPTTGGSDNVLWLALLAATGTLISGMALRRRIGTTR